MKSRGGRQHKVGGRYPSLYYLRVKAESWAGVSVINVIGKERAYECVDSVGIFGWVIGSGGAVDRES